MKTKWKCFDLIFLCRTMLGAVLISCIKMNNKYDGSNKLGFERKNTDGRKQFFLINKISHQAIFNSI